MLGEARRQAGERANPGEYRAEGMDRPLPDPGRVRDSAYQGQGRRPSALVRQQRHAPFQSPAGPAGVPRDSAARSTLVTRSAAWGTCPAGEMLVAHGHHNQQLPSRARCHAVRSAGDQ